MSVISCVGSSSSNPPCSEKQVLMLEGPSFLFENEYDIDGGYDWKEDVIISLVQYWIHMIMIIITFLGATYLCQSHLVLVKRKVSNHVHSFSCL